MDRYCIEERRLRFRQDDGTIVYRWYFTYSDGTVETITRQEWPSDESVK